jgi:thiosulfate/3-mercaptopyruvate sulfurtransferase
MRRREFITLLGGAMTAWSRAALAQSAGALTENIAPLVSVSWLNSRRGEKNLVVLDIRSADDGPAFDEFSKGHIPGAIHSDFDTAGWRVSRRGLPLMLPVVRQLEALIGDLGIDEASHVVVVSAGIDATDFDSAARVYWTLRVSGIRNVSILEGGFAAWRTAPEAAVETGMTQPSPTIFAVTIDKKPVAEVGDVETIEQTGGATLIDARPASYFSGREKVPAVKAYGHIPGALSLDSAAFYDTKTNRLKPKAELAKIASFLPRGPIVTYCNSGLWSSTDWFVLSELLHRPDVKLYYGSMIEWTSDPRHRVD